MPAPGARSLLALAVACAAGGGGRAHGFTARKCLRETAALHAHCPSDGAVHCRGSPLCVRTRRRAGAPGLSECACRQAKGLREGPRTVLGDFAGCVDTASLMSLRSVHRAERAAAQKGAAETGRFAVAIVTSPRPRYRHFAGRLLSSLCAPNATGGSLDRADVLVNREVPRPDAVRAMWRGLGKALCGGVTIDVSESALRAPANSNLAAALTKDQMPASNYITALKAGSRAAGDGALLVLEDDVVVATDFYARLGKIIGALKAKQRDGALGKWILTLYVPSQRGQVEWLGTLPTGAEVVPGIYAAFGASGAEQRADLVGFYGAQALVFSDAALASNLAAHYADRCFSAGIASCPIQDMEVKDFVMAGRAELLVPQHSLVQHTAAGGESTRGFSPEHHARNFIDDLHFC